MLYLIPPAGSGPATPRLSGVGCVAACAGHRPASSVIAAGCSPPSPARSHRPSARAALPPSSAGLFCGLPACLRASFGWAGGPPDVAPSPSRRLGCAGAVRAGASLARRPRGARAGLASSEPLSAFPVRRLARAGAPLPLSWARRIRSCGRVPLLP